jgi:threonine dehydrogenase-like Zn-dependent dehydrogenase
VNSTGAAGLEDSLIELLKPKGSLVAQGMTSEVSFSLYAALNKEISIVVSADSTREEDRQCIRFLSEQKLAILPLITHRITPHEAVELYVKPKGESVLGTVIDWRRV